jgi:hypothetical protein
MSGAYIHILGSHTGALTVHEKMYRDTIKCVSQQILLSGFGG